MARPLDTYLVAAREWLAQRDPASGALTGPEVMVAIQASYPGGWGRLILDTEQPTRPGLLARLRPGSRLRAENDALAAQLADTERELATERSTVKILNAILREDTAWHRDPSQGAAL